jgi:hypothetical protein
VLTIKKTALVLFAAAAVAFVALPAAAETPQPTVPMSNLTSPGPLFCSPFGFPCSSVKIDASGAIVDIQCGGPPVNTSPPNLTGTGSPGNVLTTTTGGWQNCASEPLNISYGWNGPHGSGSKYAVESDDVGNSIHSTITASNNEGSAAPAYSNSIGITSGSGGGGGGGGGGTSPTDTDRDGVPDSRDNCPKIINANQADSDGNGIGDACDDRWALNGVNGGTNVPNTQVNASSWTNTANGVVLCGYGNAYANWKTHAGLKLLWSLNAWVYICWRPLTNVIVRISNPGVDPKYAFKPWWKYNNDATWSFGPTGRTISWATVTASYTGCPIVIHIGCTTVNATIKFLITPPMYSATVSFS